MIFIPPVDRASVVCRCVPYRKCGRFREHLRTVYFQALYAAVAFVKNILGVSRKNRNKPVALFNRNACVFSIICSGAAGFFGCTVGKLKL